MARGRHVDLFALLLFGYTYPAAPRDLREGWLLQVAVGGPVDRDALLDAVEGVLRPNPFILDEKWSHHSADDERSTLEIGIGVPSGVGAGLIDRLTHVIGDHVSRDRPRLDPRSIDGAREDARRMLAQGRNVPADSIQVEQSHEDPPDRLRLTLRGPGEERYAVEVNKGSNLYRLTREA